MVQPVVEAQGPLSADSRKSRIKKSLALFVLFLVSVSSYADRSIMNVTQEPMKLELGLTDTQLGLLTGPVFAILYAVVGIPVARMAEKRSRKAIILGALSIWSMATTACAFVGGFFSMALARISVGGAEAASPPACHSTISDYYPARQRGRAMSFYNLSIPLGLMVGTTVGGLVTHAAGWRAAFMTLGIAGLVLAVVSWFVLAEPARGGNDGEHAHVGPVGHMQAFKMLLTSRTFLLLMVANGLAGIASHGISSFSASFFMRQHHMSLPEVTGLLALGKGAIGFAGVLTSGYLADKLALRGTRSYVTVPAMGALGVSLVFLVAFSAPSAQVAVIPFVCGFFFSNMIPSPSFAAVQNMVPAQVRATAAALLLFMITVVGSVGPWIVGGASDASAAVHFPAELGAYAVTCPAGRAVAGAPAALAQACSAASASGLTQAMLIPVAIYGLVSLTFFLAAWSTGKTLKL